MTDNRQERVDQSGERRDAIVKDRPRRKAEWTVLEPGEKPRPIDADAEDAAKDGDQ